MRPGRTKLDELCAGAKEALQQAGAKILLVPHARHILSDAPSSISWHRDHAAMGVMAPAVDPELVAGLQSRFPAGQPTM